VASEEKTENRKRENGTSLIACAVIVFDGE
jgi:hypothetical protein